MSRENVRRFVQQVAQDSQLAQLVKKIPAGAEAEIHFAALAMQQGCPFSVEDLRQEASDTGATASLDDDSATWVLGYFYGTDGKFAR